ncbi:pipD [Symbiodinium sp. CCMP2592]|nr:pipD [Symbiodinium sp. CCMP2592]
MQTGKVPINLRRFMDYLGQDHLTGVLYGLVNLIVCVPSLVSYAHIVFPQAEFLQYMPAIVKIYFLSSAVMQLAMTLLSSIVFSIGQIQDVGLIFLAGMVRNIVHWGRLSSLSPAVLVTTGLWQCLSSTVIVGIGLIVVGCSKVSQYIQMLPLPVVGGYLGYIGYFCLAAGLSIGTGREVNGPETLLQLLDPALHLKLLLLSGMTLAMLLVHFQVKHFLGMPVLLMLLPVLFFVAAAAVGTSVEECRELGLLPYPRPEPDMKDFFDLFSPSRVQGQMLKMNAVKDASATGFPIVRLFVAHESSGRIPDRSQVSHSDDSGPSTTDVRLAAELQNLVRVPRQKWPKGSTRKLFEWHIPYPRMVTSSLGPAYEPVDGQEETCSNHEFVPIGEIPQVEETWAYWDTEYGMQNEWGLSIGESTGTGMTVGWPATPDKPWGFCRVGIEDLTKLAMERCRTARCAVQTMGDIAVDQGFFSSDSGSPDKPAYSGSSEVLVVGDAEPGELWIFNVLTGRNNASAIWAAQRVPSNHVVAVGNSFTIRSLNLSDSENNLFSPGVTDLAVEKGWWHPSEAKFPGVFDFFGAYGYQPTAENTAIDDIASIRNLMAYYSGRRMWRIFSLLSPGEGEKLDPNLGNLPKTKNPYPPSVPAPRGSVTRSMVMNTLRDHYEGTPYDLTKGMAAGPHGTPNRGPITGIKGQWERAISMFRTAYSYVLEIRPNRRSITWFGYDAAHGTVWMPFYGSSPIPAPQMYTAHGLNMSTFNTDAAWWAFNLVNQYSDINFQLINGETRAKANEIELEAAKLVKVWEASVDSSGEEDDLAILAAKTNAYAEAKVQEWWKFAWYLIAKYGRCWPWYPWLTLPGSGMADDRRSREREEEKEEEQKQMLLLWL